ncbi:MAG: fatty acid desaturase [Rhodobacter sp.]|nr:fatty acid desaturase [Rhodobacter sp.]
MARLVSEWPTFALLILCYAVWALGTTWAAGLWLPLGIAVTALAIALFASLQHEMIHGHPFENATLNAALVFPGLTLFIPYLRFRDTHLDHHRDARLTDPYDDPETNYLDPAVWQRLPRPVRTVLSFNNTLFGRVTVGTAVSLAAVACADIRYARQGDRRVISGWLWHIPALLPVAWWLAAIAQMPVWAYILAAYAGLSLIKIRTFLEHQADRCASGRTVIIEDRGPLAWLFLNNNLHVVHHMHPRVAWYDLPALYASNRQRYLDRNGGYRYRSYAEIFRRYFLRRKDPVPHPFWQ